jgi:hypothetical protein
MAALIFIFYDRNPARVQGGATNFVGAVLPENFIELANLRNKITQGRWRLSSSCPLKQVRRPSEGKTY